MENKHKSPYLDPSVERKIQDASHHMHLNSNTPMCSVVEINILAACNRKCPFCPVSFKDFYKSINSKGIMKEDFYQKVLGDLKKLNYRGKIMFSGNSEPLLHKKVETFITMTKQMLPDVQNEIVTNGDFLTVEKLKSLFCAGLDFLSVSLYDGPEQFDKFQQMIEESGVDGKKIILRRRFLQNGDYGTYFSNRGGMIDVESFKGIEEKNSVEVSLPMSKPCYYPFYLMKIDFNGDVMVCSHDWARKAVVGNVNDTQIWDLWTGKKMSAIREELSCSNRNIKPCDQCDVHGEIIGKENFDKWKEVRFSTPQTSI